MPTYYRITYTCSECGAYRKNSPTLYQCKICNVYLCRRCYQYGLCRSHYGMLDEYQKNLLKKTRTMQIVGCLMCIVIPSTIGIFFSVAISVILAISICCAMCGLSSLIRNNMFRNLADGKVVDHSFANRRSPKVSPPPTYTTTFMDNFQGYNKPSSATTVKESSNDQDSTPQDSSSDKFCPQCGTAVKPFQKICINCGAILNLNK